MSFLDELRSARQTPAAAHQEFLLRYQSSLDDIHAFFEGHEDLSFYCGFIRAYITKSRNLHVYKCGNKTGVLNTREKVLSVAQSGAYILFFVDKDLSDILGEMTPTGPDIYVTDYYSIENHLVSADMLQTVWEQFFSFGGVKIDFDMIKSGFDVELGRFYTWTSHLMAWIILLMKNRHRPLLNNLDLSRFCDIDDELSFTGQDLSLKIAELDKVCRVTTPIDSAPEIDTIIAGLVLKEPKLWVRGKFELWFFLSFVDSLANSLRTNILQAGQSLKIHTQIHQGNAIEVLGPRTPIPISLDKFLKANLVSQSVS